MGLSPKTYPRTVDSVAVVLLKDLWKRLVKIQAI